VTTQQTGDDTSTGGESQPNDYPSRHYGYFSGMLTTPFGPGTGGYYFTSNLADLDASGKAEGVRDSTDVGDMYYDGSGAPGIKQITGLTHDGNTVDSGLPATVDYWVYGHDSFMIWGGWRQPYAMTGGGIEHYFDYRGYFFVGDYTTDSQMAALQNSLGVVTYSGHVWAKHAQQPAGTDMSGSFTAQVDFSSPSITDFDMSASGGGHSASITDAHGDFTGNSSQFVINPSSGTWKVDNVSALHKQARGGLYGDQGQKMGVIWAIKETSGSSNLAWGMCVGGR